MQVKFHDRLARGMKPLNLSKVALKFSAVLNATALPRVPAQWGHVKTPQVPGNFGMLANDRYGCCVVSGAEHETMVWNWANRKAIPYFDDAVSLRNYDLCGRAQGNPPFNPRDPNTDNGLDPVQAADWRRTVGLQDASGKTHRINAYAAIDDLNQVNLGGFMFGCTGLAMQLPDSAETQFENAQVWSDLSGAPTGGHYIPVVGRNSAGQIFVVTWGRLQGMTNEYFQKYATGALVYLDPEYLNTSGVSPEAFNTAQLNEFLAALPNA